MRRYQFGPALALVAALSLPSAATSATVATTSGAPARNTAMKPAAPAPTADARIETYVTPAGDGFFALSLQPAIAQPKSPPHDVLVLFDTSASQTGAYRDKALSALRVLIHSLRRQDRLRLLAVDLRAVSLTDDFVAPGDDAIERALTALERRVPLGSTDMHAALNATLEVFRLPAAGRARSVVYVGDGMSSAHPITAATMREFADRLNAAQAPVTSFAIGPQVDLQLLGSLAKNSGGKLLIDGSQMAARDAGQQLANTADGLVFWPDKLELPAGFKPVYYRGTPPLRFDRDTVVIGVYDPPKAKLEQLPVRITGLLAGQAATLDWSVPLAAPSEDGAYLGVLVALGLRDGGVTLPSAGTAALAELRGVVHNHTRMLVLMGERALASGDAVAAEQLADEAAQLDPQNPAASIIRQAVDRVHRDGRSGRPVNRLRLVSEPAANRRAEAPREAADGQLLDEVERRHRMLETFLRRDVRIAIEDARSLMATDPEAAINTLKLAMDRTADITDISAETRQHLIDQLEGALRTANYQTATKSDRDLRQQQLLAEAEARERMNRELFLQEEKVDQLMARFNALMDEERYRDAEALADIAEEIQGARPGLRGAELTARMTGYTADMNAVRDLRHKGVIDAMYQIELSHIPTPDEPPILYPDPEVWQLLTERRKKYKAVDLQQNNENEERILAALDDKTVLEFTDQPLSDAIQYLKDRHDIEIQLDEKALEDEGIGTDTPVSRNISGITLRSALRLLLGELDLTYVVKNEVLLITTKAEAEALLVTKVYPVGDLVIPIPQMRMRMGGRGMM
jgi:hypothetical protein